MRTDWFLATIVAAFCVIARAEDGEGENETAESKLKVEVLVEPPEDCKRKSEKGDILQMHYKGTLASDGTEFDSSYGREKPFFFTLGVGEVIKGWDEGLTNMCVGEKRKLTVPPELGYGEKGAGDTIPGDATLIFEVELLEMRDGMNPTNVFKDIDRDGDEQLSQDEVRLMLVERITWDKKFGQHLSTPEVFNKTLKMIISEHDHDQNGFISFEEFLNPKRASQDDDDEFDDDFDDYDKDEL